DRYVLCRRDGAMVRWDVSTPDTSVAVGVTERWDPLAGQSATSQLVFCSGHGRVTVVDGPTGKRIVELTSHTDAVRSAGFVRGGRMLVTSGASWDRSVRVWDTRQLNSYAVRRAHDGQVQDLAFANAFSLTSKSGEELVSWAIVDGRLERRPGLTPPS